MNKEMMDKLIEKIENQTFDENDIRRFLHMFARNKEFKNLAIFERLCSVRLKGRIKIYEVAKKFETSNRQYTILNSNQEYTLYQSLSNELKEFCKQADICINEQAIKEIILCIYSLMQFTHKYLKARLCLIQSEHSISLGALKGNTITIISTISNVHHYKQFNQGLITDPVRIKRIDGKIKIINSDKEIISELEYN